MSKKRKKRGQTKPSTLLPVTYSVPGRSGKFYWGLAAGFTCTLLVTIAMDLGWIPTGRGAHAETAPSAVPETRDLTIAGKIPNDTPVASDTKIAKPRTNASV